MKKGNLGFLGKESICKESKDGILFEGWKGEEKFLF